LPCKACLSVTVARFALWLSAALAEAHLAPNVVDHVEFDRKLYTDAHTAYVGLDHSYVHNVINHAHQYVNGHIHTNGIENFWSLLKRSLKGILCFGRRSTFSDTWMSKRSDSTSAKNRRR